MRRAGVAAGVQLQHNVHKQHVAMQYIKCSMPWDTPSGTQLKHRCTVATSGPARCVSTLLHAAVCPTDLHRLLYSTHALSATYRRQQREQVWQWRLPACGQRQRISQKIC
jgi:hypothetical protein